MKFLFTLLFLAAPLLSAIEAPLPEGIKNDQNPNDKTISPQEALKLITVPEGFKVTLFAGEPDLSQPIAFTFDDRGRLWVVQNFSHPFYKEVGHDTILIFEDTDGDGTFDKRKVFWDKGQFVTGIQFGHGGVWICNSPNLQFIPDKDGDDVPDSEPITVLDGWNMKGKNNIFNNLNWGPDGWLYGCIGQNDKSFVGAPGTPKEKRGMITRGLWGYHPTSKVFEVVGRGAVNPWGFDFDDHGEAFFTNCVLAHAWHYIPGAYYQRRGSETDFKDIYGRIQPIADHLHWAGGHWTSSRNAVGKHSNTGGGHAHTGCMIYMGGNWPDKYRGSLFVGNLHGNRINNDILSRKGSSYVASHGDDFLNANHPWFRTLSQKYGPDGGVYISDWHDLGECHDHDGTHRTSGRIYKVTYGDTKHEKFDLTKYSNEQLVELQLHKNEWFVRHARRLLNERALAGVDMKFANEALMKIFDKNPSVPKKLRALWCLNLTGGMDDNALAKLLNHESENIRSWALRLINDDKQISKKILAALKKLASSEKSSLVRLHLAAQLQRLSVKERSGILLSLVMKAEDKADRMIPKMLYFAAIDVLAQDKVVTTALISRSRIPLFTEYMTRLTVTRDYDLFKNKILPLIPALSDDTALAAIKGTYESLLRKSNPEMPSSWSAVYKQLLDRKHEELSFNSTLLALKFKDSSAPVALKALVKDKNLNPDVRRKSLDALIKSKDKGLFAVLKDSIDDKELAEAAINGLAGLNNKTIPELLFTKFASLDAKAKAAVFTTLCSRESFTTALFSKLEDKSLPSSLLSSFHIRQIQLFENEELNTRLKKIWGDIKKRSESKEKELAKYKKLLTKKFLSQGDAKNGKEVFTRTCGACHKLFGEGGIIGPDLTGSGRKDLHYILENVIDPSAIVGKDFQLVSVKTKDNRFLSGTIAEENKDTVTIKTLNDKVILQRSNIESLQKSQQSMMPEGLFNILNKNDLRDIIKYLQQ
ncbi:MAG: c-type cytochrome [Lentisphaeraceae bacterium]|nr:c-type cytochrome [Lentisphaeraceae bacterium]